MNPPQDSLVTSFSPELPTSAVPRAEATRVVAERDRHAAAERILALVFFIDIVVVFAGLLAAFWVRFFTPIAGIGVYDGNLTPSAYVGHFIFGGALYSFLLVNSGLYRARKLLRFRRALRMVLHVSALWLLSYLALSLILRVDPPISRVYTMLGFTFVVVGLVAWRWMFSLYIQRDSVASELRQRVLFVGWSEQSTRFYESMREDVYRPYDLAGFISVGEDERGGDRFIPQEVQKLGDLESLRHMIDDHAVDMVMVVDDQLDRGTILGIANDCEKEMVEFKLLPSSFQILLSGLSLENMSGIPVLGVSQLPLYSPVNIYLKRLVDIVGGVIGLVCAAPLIALFSFLVYRESPGAVFYKQRRIGRNGISFDILKIRSMRLDAEKDGKVGWSKKVDDRRLKVGSFMRKWNIDELPQFWNVLTGEMSLVGPRPERPELIQDFRETIPHYNARHHIKPGITGWAQINGLRGDTDLTERINCDIFYIENWNLWLDFQIMILTFFKRDGAA